MVTFAVVPVASPMAVEALRGYFASVGAAFRNRELSDDEVTQTMRDNLSPDLDPPRGLFVVAHEDGVDDKVLGCAGLHWLDGDRAGPMAEVKHLHVTEQARGQGLGERLMRDLEQRAAEAGCVALRLDTRSNLYAARRLYDRLGFTEIPRYNDNPMSQNWYEKAIS